MPTTRCLGCGREIEFTDDEIGKHFECAVCGYLVLAKVSNGYSSLVRFVCPACNKANAAPSTSAGKKGKCVRCGQRLQIPHPPSSQTVLGNPEPDSEPFTTDVTPVPPAVPSPAWQTTLPPIKDPPGEQTEQPPLREPDTELTPSVLQTVCHCSECRQPLTEYDLLPQAPWWAEVNSVGQWARCPHCGTEFKIKVNEMNTVIGISSSNHSLETQRSSKSSNVTYCHECGSTIRTRAEICPHCGFRQSVGQWDQAWHYQPHRATTIWALGIFGLFTLPFVFGPMALLMANEELRKMRQGIMDPAGQSSTQMGKTLGIINIVWAFVIIVLQIFVIGVGLLGCCGLGAMGAR